MLSNFKGYLLKFGNAVFPQKYLAQSPTFTPNQRTEAEAYRDVNNDLHRVTINNHKTKIEFSTIPNITLEQKIEIENAMRSGLINEVERKYSITYWNDDINDYKSGVFYISDISYNIVRVDTKRNTIVYDAVSYSLIEY